MRPALLQHEPERPHADARGEVGDALTPARVLVLGGWDPTGRAGVARDLAALASERVAAAAVPTCLTVQDERRVLRVEPVSPDIFRKSLDAATREPVDALKIGLVASNSVVEAVQGFVQAHGVPVVFDPVTHARSGDALSAPEVAGSIRELASMATLLTPNLPEAASLAGRAIVSFDDRAVAARALLTRGAGAVLVKGGHGGESPGVDLLVTREGTRELPFERVDLSDPRVGRGKGCEAASRIAALLAKGVPLEQAAPLALRRLRERIAFEAHAYALPAAASADVKVYAGVLEQLLGGFEGDCVPEVGTNLAFAPHGCRSPSDVIGLAGRVTIAGDSFDVVGQPRPGGPHHTGRIAYAAATRLARPAWAFNHRFDEKWLPGLGSDHVGLSRRDEPPYASSSMEWMTEAAIARLGRLPAYVSDPGWPGREAMIRVLAHTPEALLTHHDRLHRRVDGRESLEDALAPTRPA